MFYFFIANSLVGVQFFYCPDQVVEEKGLCVAFTPKFAGRDEVPAFFLEFLDDVILFKGFFSEVGHNT